jgi:hypothetical protein
MDVTIMILSIGAVANLPVLNQPRFMKLTCAEPSSEVAMCSHADCQELSCNPS